MKILLTRLRSRGVLLVLAIRSKPTSEIVSPNRCGRRKACEEHVSMPAFNRTGICDKDAEHDADTVSDRGGVPVKPRHALNLSPLQP